jgi:hypothetical protein
MKESFIDKDTLEAMVLKRETTNNQSCFSFLKNHNGIRPGCLHSIIAATGASKSTLVRSILLELAIKSKILLLLNEESCEEYSLDMNLALRNSGMKEENIERVMKNIICIHEVDDDVPTSMNPEDERNFFKYIKQKIAQTQAEIFVYDNITSGFISRLNPSMQNEASKEIIGLCRRMKIAMIAVLHTVKDLKPNIMTRSEHVRGVAIFPINSSFVYTLSMFSYDGKKRAVLWNTKARGYPEADGKKYELTYNQKHRLYVADNNLTESGLVEIYEWMNPKKGAKNGY